MITPGSVALVLSSVIVSVGLAWTPPQVMRVPACAGGRLGEHAGMTRTASPSATRKRCGDERLAAEVETIKHSGSDIRWKHGEAPNGNAQDRARLQQDPGLCGIAPEPAPIGFPTTPTR